MGKVVSLIYSYIPSKEKGGGPPTNVPKAMICTLFSEARPDCRALLLDNGPLVRNSLGRADIADELFHCGWKVQEVVSEGCGRERCPPAVCPIVGVCLQELIVRCQGPLGGRREYLDQIEREVGDAMRIVALIPRGERRVKEIYLIEATTLHSGSLTFMELHNRGGMNLGA